MPLSPAAARREVHHRVIDMKTYAREDGLFDVEAHLVDTKPFDFVPLALPKPVFAGQPIHDMWIRLTVDGSYVVRAIEAASDTTPYPVCKGAQDTLSVLVGEPLAKGWSAKVKERLRGAASCTHLMEMLIPLATTALQGIWGTDTSRLQRLAGEGGEGKLDSCYAYGRSREVVKMQWPQYYVPADERDA
ncbi:MAG: DUF2889 domain-containing protein [Ottowia sp.]|uniref:DUF2889 domain-containing protein n=1 Tax=Ottowia sp. TaxID=1898956 RepID=UPI003C716D3A